MKSLPQILTISLAIFTATAFAEEPLREITAPHAELAAPAFYKKFIDTSGYLIHEMAHNIHLRLDPTFDDRLRKTYDAVKTDK